MSRKIMIIPAVLLNLLLAFQITPVQAQEGKYINYLVLENNSVYGVKENKGGKNIPVELKGEEKIQAILTEFAMKDEITLGMLKPDGSHKYVLKVLSSEKNTSVKLLLEWLRDKSPLNQEKASYLLKQLGYNKGKGGNP
ncbi:MAG: hypothetical protein HY892_16610 [Deltaproteobacteria bacterium]|nr:hypothetical protein [Deltaproteobacteria bacterium]